MINSKFKILIITRSAWDDSNSIGNTLSNFWSGLNNENIANLYCRSALPKNNICENYFSITEKDILRAFYYIKIGVGKKISLNNQNRDYERKNEIFNEDKIYNKYRKKSSLVAKYIQEIIWSTNIWKSQNLNNFLDDFKPDIIFAPCFSTSYNHRLLWYVQKYTLAKVILFHADDYISYKFRNDSILMRMNNLFRSNRVKKSINQADLNYCISEKQQHFYSLNTGKEMKLLYKGGDFNSKPIFKNYSNPELIRLVYVGSTLYGRWETLALLAQELNEINKTKKLFELLIYSQYQPAADCLNAMIVEGTSKFMGAVAADKVNEVYKNSDIVLHVESFDENEKMKTRLSFSTKIVDCLHSERCVFAIGWEEAASISYLSDNNAALIANNKSDIKKVIKSITKSPDIIEKYAQNAWHCGKKNHQIKDIQNNLYSDIQLLLKNN